MFMLDWSVWFVKILFKFNGASEVEITAYANEKNIRNSNIS